VPSPTTERPSINETLCRTYDHTTLFNGTWETKAYLQRIKITEEPTCTCGKVVQTTDHLIVECEKLTKEREKLKTTAILKGNWLTNKKDLIRKHYKDFVKFINDIPFDKLNSE
jgi:hypothetical protein